METEWDGSHLKELSPKKPSRRRRFLRALKERKERIQLATKSRLVYWGKIGAILGGLWGLMLGVIFFIFPNLASAPTVVAITIVAAAEGAFVVVLLNTSWFLDRMEKNDSKYGF